MLRHLPLAFEQPGQPSHCGGHSHGNAGRENSDFARCGMRSILEYRRSSYDDRILVVHHQPDIINMISSMFRKVGYRNITVGNSATAIQHMKQKPCDLLFTELEMPTVDGHSLACLFKTYHPHAKALVMTCRCQAELVDLIKEGTVDGWLYKPFDICTLSDILIHIGRAPQVTPMQDQSKAELQGGKV